MDRFKPLSTQRTNLQAKRFNTAWPGTLFVLALLWITYDVLVNGVSIDYPAESIQLGFILLLFATPVILINFSDNTSVTKNSNQTPQFSPPMDKIWTSVQSEG